jgi:hypothetical protein
MQVVSAAELADGDGAAVGVGLAVTTTVDGVDGAGDGELVAVDPLPGLLDAFALAAADGETGVGAEIDSPPAQPASAIAPRSVAANSARKRWRFIRPRS